MPSVTAPAPSRSSSPPASASDPGRLAIYLHWPFCTAKCPYCDFNVHIRAAVDEGFWRDAFLAELDAYRARTGRRTVTSIYFGGGTPSLMAPATVAALIERIARHWALAADVEISLEANPAERGRFAGLSAAGVNRLSLGVQAFDDAALRFLGRDHSAVDATAALDEAGRRFARLSFDLIYALPDQTVAAWQAALGAALSRARGHLSLYQLTIERGTAFHDAVRRGAFAPPDDDRAADLYAATQDACAAAGLPAYEISNHAALGEESRYNLACWTGGDYLGVGPGAHGRLTEAGVRRALSAYRKPETWAARVAAFGIGAETDDALTAREAQDETILLALRTVGGLARAAFRARFGVEIEACVDRARLADLCAHGLVIADADGLRATAAGRPLLDAILGALLA